MSSDVVLVQGINARISQGSVDDLTPSPSPSWAVLDCISREITYQGGTSTEIDVTTLCSTAKELRVGLEDTGTISITGHWVQTSAAHDVIRQAASDKLPRLVEINFSDGSIFRALAMVTQRSWSAAVDGVVSATYSFRLTGPVLEIDATA